MKDYLPLILSACAVSFTIGSFWWLNARLGKLVTNGPQYCFGSFDNEKLAIQLPVVFENTGPKPIVISALRLRFLYAHRDHLVWVGFSENPLKPNVEFKSPIAVKGFGAIGKTLYFHREGVKNLTTEQEVQLEGIWSNKNSWRVLATFKLPASTEGWEPHFTGIDIIGGIATGERFG